MVHGELFSLLSSSYLFAPRRSYVDGRVYTAVIHTKEFDHDYRYAIIQYMKFRGMVIKSHGCGLIGEFVITYTGATNDKTFTEFVNEYIPGRYIDGAYISVVKWLVVIAVISYILIKTLHYFN